MLNIEILYYYDSLRLINLPWISIVNVPSQTWRWRLLTSVAICNRKHCVYYKIVLLQNFHVFRLNNIQSISFTRYGK